MNEDVFSILTFSPLENRQGGSIDLQLSCQRNYVFFFIFQAGCMGHSARIFSFYHFTFLGHDWHEQGLAARLGFAPRN
jgi:hypothetical protein